MSILQEVDRALYDETAKLATAPRDTDFVIVLNTPARNEFMKELYEMQSFKSDTMRERYRGAVLAVIHDSEMPRVSILTKVKS